jgi:TfoX/Sxy family transcriptional regulator of competence genes
MPTSKKTIAYLTDQLASLYGVSTKRMFGEYCLYFDGAPIAFVCSDQLFIKPTKTNKQLLTKELIGYPYPGAKPYFLIPADQWEDAEWLRELIAITAKELRYIKKPES